VSLSVTENNANIIADDNDNTCNNIHPFHHHTLYNPWPWKLLDR